MKFYSQPLTAGVEQRFDVKGRVLLIDDTGAATTVDVTILDDGGSPIHIITGRKKGFKALVNFGGVILKSAVDTTVVFFASFDDIDISITDGSAVTVPGGVKVTNPVGDPVNVSIVNPITLTATDVGVLSQTTITTVADVSINATVSGVLMAAAGAGVKQREVIVRNLSTNASEFRIGENGVAAARGYPLAPGETITLDTLAAVYGYNSGAAAQSVAVLTNTR